MARYYLTAFGLWLLAVALAYGVACLLTPGAHPHKCTTDAECEALHGVLIEESV